MSRNLANIPHLRHTENRAGNTAPKRNERRDAKRQLAPVIVLVRLIVRPAAAAEDEVLFDEDRAEDREPVAQDREQRVEPLLKVARADDREHDVHDAADDDNEYAWDRLRVRVDVLERQRERVDVRDVVRDDAQREDHEQEAPEPAHRPRQPRAEQPADRVGGVRVRPGRLRRERGHCGRAEALDEDERDVEPDVRPYEDLD